MYRKNEWDGGDSGLPGVAAAQSAPRHRAHQPDQDEAAKIGTAEAPSVSPAAPIPTAPHQVEPAPAAPSRRESQRRLSRRKLAVGLLLVPLLAGAAWFGQHWWTIGRFTVSTDDAYVAAYNTTLAAKVSGYVAKVLASDDQHVRAGEAVAIIDDGDYRLAVDSAREKVATQQAAIARIGHQIDAQNSAVVEAQAQVASAQAADKRMQLELVRQTTLAAKDFASRQTLEQAEANRDQAIAAVTAARAALESAIANVAVLKGQQQEAIGTLSELKTALAKAERDLSFTIIRAPLDGVIGNRAVQVGDFVQPGQRLASLVPLDEVYVDANFKETQLARLRPGQKASIEVDALPQHAIAGTVESFSPASGSVFSLLPPDNATGNFTKIVQRLPVRIRVPAAIAREGLLRPGMSVVVSVDTKPTALAERSAATRSIAAR